MENILFFDLEISETRKTIKEIGAVYRGDDFRSPSFQKFRDFSHDARFICGHNIFAHDLHYLNKAYMEMDLFKKDIIDTLFFSALLFPERPYHHLVKDYRLVTEFVNDPVADAKIASRLLGDLVKRFRELPRDLKVVYYNLLDGQREFKGFFKLFKQADLPGRMKPDSLAGFIVENFKKSLCIHSDIAALITREPVEFCYAMALINTIDERSVTPPWLLYRFPKINEVLYKLRLIRCDMEGCLYCNEFLSPLNALKGLFGFFEFRSFDGDAGRPLQELVVEAALAKESLLAVFPTGGGKSLAFQLPALMMGRADRSLTVVISPLQSLMKDQVDVLEKRYDIVDAVAISGLLSPLERSQAIERVREGGAGILYISPESLRSNTILNLLKGRSINRFVIDEAHCFSSWGQDFRVDYLYIADFIAELQREKGLSQPIPVSCFTATAKPAVINDILTYFKKKLGLDLRLFKTDSKRKNLHYHVYEVHDKRSKYDTLKALLQAEEGFVIIYVSRVKTAEALAESLSRDGFNALPYHGKMPRDKKIETQSRFMEGGVRIIVATSAFGMGVDKDNVSMVIHYDISDSLENYIQESGRAGRRSDMDAGCYILYDKNDLNRHFELLNLGKMNHKQIAQIWRAIKDFKRLRFNKSSLEIAKAAGWDIELAELETRVKLAIAALEDCGYVRRGQDSPKVFATGIRVRNVQEANEKIRLNASRFSEEEMGHAIRIFQFLISREEARVDYMADVLGIERDTVARILNIFKEIELIGDTRDMTAFIDISQGKGNALHVLGNYAELEKRMASLLYPDEEHKMRKVYLKEINEHMVKEGISDCSISMIRDILRYWELRHYIKKKRIEAHTWLYEITFRCDRDKFVKEMHQRLDLTAQVMNIVFKYARSAAGREEQERKSVPFEFSMTGLKKDTECSGLFTKKLPIGDYEDVLLYLNTIGALKLERGLLICYRPMTIERVEKNSRRHYSKQEYKKLEDFYRNKVEQIHIVGEYAKMKLKDHEGAIRFIDDYFSMPYSDFIKKYFPGRKGEIRHPITEERFKMLFSALSLEQMQIIKDNSHKRILVAAGPGSGKTRVLVHKVASLLLLEDVKPEQFLMLTFSRPAAMEFKERLYKLIENTAYYIDIATYHSYAFNLLGRIGSLEESRSVIQRATEAIDKKEVSLERLLNKSVIVGDEYQDISSEEYAFLNAIIAAAQELRVVVVGDDDQNIYEFRGSSVKYMRSFIKDQDAVMYFLGRNYRSRKNLVDFANLFLNFLPDNRIKKGHSIVSDSKENGEIKLVKYGSTNLVAPLVKDIWESALIGTTAVLTRTNEEALLAENLLNQEGAPARLISARKGFALGDLLEIRGFDHYIGQYRGDQLGLILEQDWNSAREKTMERFRNSTNLDLALKVIDHFKNTNPRIFLSEWNSYLYEIKIEDFYFPEKDIIMVSTMHKAKGKEFDNVYLLLANCPFHKTEDKRVVYMAITRAKNNLVIHTNSSYFDSFDVECMNKERDASHYEAPQRIILQCSMEDVWLGYFKNSAVIRNINKLTAGDKLAVSTDDQFAFVNESGNPILKLSTGFKEKISTLFEKGYHIASVNAGYIIVWRDKEDRKNYRVVLPDIVLKREK